MVWTSSASALHYCTSTVTRHHEYASTASDGIYYMGNSAKKAGSGCNDLNITHANRSGYMRGQWLDFQVGWAWSHVGRVWRSSTQVGLTVLMKNMPVHMTVRAGHRTPHGWLASYSGWAF